MTGPRIALAGGAAAILAAGALYLFPPFSGTKTPARIGDGQFAHAQNIFASALEKDGLGTARLDEVGLVTGTISGADNAVLLSEPDGECAGRGIYWLNEDAGSSLAITAPHRGSDRHTGTLAAALFLETGARAAGWNSSPRRASATCAEAIDLARSKDHLFSAFTLGFAQAVPEGLIVQLHGFDGAKRESFAARDAVMILSNGTNQPTQRLLRLADDLSLAFAPQEVLVFPIGTKELGATTNAQAQLLQEAGFEGFVHIEISAGMRAALVEDAGLRGKLARALLRAAQ